ncbi:hypothetical protein [Hoeflea alexandrii]|uniref:Baseplate protein J-like domain-containing protein n=1 Tax=Hoeflea alexandrii TaxID=288436 RepID=A0ABT1CMC4_9HYPH|nr:hypothetical protein [Hoeflea alexandrii]MCO6407372.1 hypothetical protein [Hoeflea alexandrii]MCY0154231.1 hypothetical protein [Hoeflea alexandrii]
MTDYGPISTGFSRKPLNTILAEIEASLITEFGPGIIQTSQSPMGQINGIFAEGASKAWELSENIYQSLDPDQAEGIRLDILGRIRRIVRAAGETDESFRRAITNAGQSRIDIQDVSRAIAALDGVTYSYVWVRDNAEDLADSGMAVGSVCIAVTGGDDDEIATSIRQYIAPGVSQFGSTAIESVVDGYCRTFRVLRPIDVPVELTVIVRTFKDGLGCPPPSASAIKTSLLEGLYLLNGEDISFYRVRSVIETAFSNVEVLTINGERDEIAQGDNQPVIIGFIERASLASADVTITVNA